jgi:alkylation response protein AidB-like acyl-CoA dehydrogenase
MVAFAQEAQRVGAPLIALGTTFIIASVIRECASEELKQEILPRVLDGEILIVLGYSEPNAGSDVASVSTKATWDGDEWVIDGQKMFTTNAHVATHAFMLCRTDPSLPKHRGLTTFLVPLDQSGVTISPVQTLGGERTNITFYDGVRVPDRFRVGEVNGGWATMNVALVFERGGGGSTTLPETGPLLSDAVAWAAEPDPVTGRRRLDDPRIRERLARVAIDDEVAKLLDLRVRWLAARGGQPQVEGSMSKLFESEALVDAASELQDMLGPAGVLREAAPGAPAAGELEHAFRHACVTTIYGGTSEVQRGIIAERALGLPRARPRVS